MHVIGPFDRFPLAAERAYNVPEAPLEAYERMTRRVGLARTVLVQASGHGTDNRAMLAALKELGERGRGIAVVSGKESSSHLENLNRAGVRGVRLNLVTLRSRYSGDLDRLVAEHERLCAPLGWHLQVFADGETLLALEPALRRSRVAVVVDHMGLPEAGRGIAQPGFQALLRLMREEHVWAKLAGADRITRAGGGLRDAIPFMRALAAVAPQRLVWGSDWPHIGFHAGKQVRGGALLPYREVDEAALLEVLREAAGDAALLRAVLSDNPARLYR